MAVISYAVITAEIVIEGSTIYKVHIFASCFGVVGMVPRGSKQRFLGLISKKDRLDTGVVVRGDFSSITVDLHIVVTYGMNINAIAKSIMHKVKYTVYEATGIKVSKVRIRVDGIKE